ncbi:MAG: hypothetical protein O2960_26330 [Verrucomicrobia bacterium]|nr:hypothetical protein [Verrucomicrobiota bacterium]
MKAKTPTILNRGSLITFKRREMTFRGRLLKNQDCFRFKRIQ